MTRLENFYRILCYAAVAIALAGCAAPPSGRQPDHEMSCDCKDCKMMHEMGDAKKSPGATPTTQPDEHAGHHPG
jgi:hypothetical protein